MNAASTTPGSPGEARRLQLLGLVYVAVLVGLVWLSVAAYRHQFDGHVTVELRARQAGQQLNVGGDVRMNGAIVGRVSGVRSSGRGASISLQLDRDAAGRIPGDVVARILPTTLFGQKFVELHSTSSARAGHLSAGDVIGEDTSAEAVELTDVVDDLDQVLTAVRPDRLSAALGGLSDGLSGRGAALGDTISTAGGYLHQLNGDTALFEHDLGLLHTVAGQYADAAPDLLATARHVTVTSRSLTTHEDTISSFVSAVTGAADTGTDLLRANRRDLAESARLARPTAELLAEYAPELDCTIQGFLAVESQSAAQIRDHSFQGAFTLGAQTGGYTSADALELGDLGTGPACRGLPRAPIPYPGVDLRDGVEDSGLIGLLTAGAVG
jgi:phospholipid/cholesterol/gamma-HCH transport system substrate-binding protein